MGICVIDVNLNMIDIQCSFGHFMKQKSYEKLIERCMDLLIGTSVELDLTGSLLVNAVSFHPLTFECAYYDGICCLFMLLILISELCIIYFSLRELSYFST